MMKPGGVRRDVSPDDVPAVRKMLGELRGRIALLRDAVVDDPLIHARTKGVGVLSKEQVVDYGAVGPTARASGVAIDVRRDHPHAAYDRVEWDVITAEGGDVYAKVVVRLLEMFESIRICEQCLDHLERSAGPIDSNPARVAPGDGIGHYEAPRGEVFHYVRSDGSNRPVRHKVRAPSYMNIVTDREAVIGHSVADATIILAAVDPCYCCTERTAAVDASTGRRVWTARDILRLSREKTERLRRETGWPGPSLAWEG
jgi:NADH-quinone oxidoreductase subunit D